MQRAEWDNRWIAEGRQRMDKTEKYYELSLAYFIKDNLH